jgi:hypothetical protein
VTDHPTAPRYTGRNTPALDRLRRIASQLGPLTERVVFIGGAVAPLLQTDAVLPRVRPTHDVDAVIATSSYAELGSLREALSARGFSEAPLPPELDAPLHMHRWIAPEGGGPFDLVPIGAHAGGTGGVPDTYAVASAVSVDLREGDTATPCIVQHVSAVAFLMLKWAAHRDRGQHAPFESHDLEDIIAVVASRASVVEECRAAPMPVREYLAERCREFLADADTAEELIAANLPLPPTSVVQVRTEVLKRLQNLAAFDEG